jgi:Raf kinase inhibitor-like YbhB/YbcL family protein
VKLSSPAFADGAPIPGRYTCDGEDLSPELHWSGVPSSAVSLAVTCVDPDAPGGPFTHWLMWNLDAAKGGLGAGEVPEGAQQGRNDFGTIGYRGPCPPHGHGPHHYHFALLALSDHLPLPDGATIAELRRASSETTIARAEVVGVYGR